MAFRPNTAQLLGALRAGAGASFRAPRRRLATRPAAATAAATNPTRRFSAYSKARTPHTTSSTDSTSNPDPAFTTVSPDEVAHFNNLASSWWDPQGPSRILHLMNPLRHDFIRSCRSSSPSNDDPAPLPPGGLRYLDIGCGGGIFAESAARLPDTLSVTAIDPSPEVLAVARAHARRDPMLSLPATTSPSPSDGNRRKKLEYINASIEQLPIPGTGEDTAQAYDVVTVFEVLEHVADPAGFLARCAPFVRPGGWLVLSTIARTWASWLATNVVAEDLLRIVPRGTHDWRKYVNEHELRNFFLGPAPASSSSWAWTDPRCMGVVYVPGLGWQVVPGSEKLGNYFFAVRKDGP